MSNELERVKAEYTRLQKEIKGLNLLMIKKSEKIARLHLLTKTAEESVLELKEINKRLMERLKKHGLIGKTS